MATAITDAEFQLEVLESDVPVLVDFWAPWCGPCRMLGEIIDEVADEVTANQAKIYKLNVDENPAVAGKYGITAIPTVIVFDKGEIKEQLVGVQQKDKYLSTLGV